MDPVVGAAHKKTCIIGFALYGLMALGSVLIHADGRAKKTAEPNLLRRGPSAASHFIKVVCAFSRRPLRFVVAAVVGKDTAFKAQQFRVELAV
jgi:hypothetical protein